jgi:hypothetical protein
VPPRHSTGYLLSPKPRNRYARHGPRPRGDRHRCGTRAGVPHRWLPRRPAQPFAAANRSQARPSTVPIGHVMSHARNSRLPNGRRRRRTAHPTRSCDSTSRPISCPAATPTRRHLLPDTVGLRQAISPVRGLALTNAPSRLQRTTRVKARQQGVDFVSRVRYRTAISTRPEMVPNRVSAMATRDTGPSGATEPAPRQPTESADPCDLSHFWPGDRRRSQQACRSRPG